MSKAKPIDILIASLEWLEPLDQRDRDLLAGLDLRLKQFGANDDIVRSGTHPGESCFIVGGFAARAQYLADGGRQLDQLHVTGDFVDLHSLHLRQMDHSVIAIGPCGVAFVRHDELVSTMAHSPRLTWLLWQLTVLDGALARTWMTCLGRRRADAAMAHLVCELLTRLRRLGAAPNNCFQFPATQADMADMLGISTVHINRILAELRSRRLLTWSRHEVHVLDFERLAHIADFDETYLAPGNPMPSRFQQFVAT
ncbi:Crp/Fnr family transcriptional regulator [Georhizobium profundi]|uniref:Crp/Fnr family transcriptional regulator n=1 Tax=Georhizobium profundi TaxID=2341112 RepID=A0A3Q8XP41_9HYPH|nr:Crp/Fnr family transcriptional regulator [Georhizobium profundi]AZN72026.1 Crp/Fnr family transcriptional regulator [Georhizobium profundi]